MASSSDPGPKTSRNILLLGFVSLLNDISSEIIQPILPLFITALGGGSVAIGLIGGFSDGLPSIFQIFSGYWSDRTRKRKPIVVAGYGISALSKLLLPIAAVWQQVFILKTVERTGKGIRSAPRDAMISESAVKEARGRGFGLHRAMDSSGAVIGSILAYVLWKGGLDFRAIMAIAGVFAIFALFPFYYVKEGSGLQRPRTKLSLSDLSPQLRRFVVIASLFALGNFSYMFFILRAREFFTGLSAIGDPLLLYAFFNIIYAVFSYPIGVWSDRVGRKKVLMLGYALFAATATGFAFVSSLAGLVLLFALYGLVFAMVDAAQSAFVSDLSHASLRSTSLGIYYGAVGVAAIFSGVTAGALWASFGPSATFLFGATAAALAALALWSMKDPEQTF